MFIAAHTLRAYHLNVCFALASSARPFWAPVLDENDGAACAAYTTAKVNFKRLPPVKTLC